MLESENRKRLLPAEEILATIGIKEGDTLIDFGCGIGYFSIPAAKLVGEQGKVIAIDISDEMISELEKRSEGFRNLDIVKSDDISGFKGDIILLVTVLHEVDNAKKFIERCFDALNPQGRIIIIDWQKKETTMGPPISHRISKDEVIAMAHSKCIEHNIDDTFYFLEFRKITI